MIDEHLIDHYVPFLPLMLKHVRQCVMAEMGHLNIKPNYDVADKVARDMPYFPEKREHFLLKAASLSDRSWCFMLINRWTTLAALLSSLLF